LNQYNVPKIGGGKYWQELGSGYWRGGGEGMSAGSKGGNPFIGMAVSLLGSGLSMFKADQNFRKGRKLMGKMNTATSIGNDQLTLGKKSAYDNVYKRDWSNNMKDFMNNAAYGGYQFGINPAYGGSATDHLNQQLFLMNGIRQNQAAYGADFSNGITTFNVGGTHESNMYGGIPQGIGENG